MASATSTEGNAPPIETVIQPNQKWLRLDFRNLWRARDLILLFVQRDFISKYKQTLLGPTWFVIQPLVQTAMFMVLQLIAGIEGQGAPLVLFNLAGLLAWQYFANVLNGTGSTFAANADLFGKIYFPRLAVPISQMLSHLLTFAVQATAFAVILLFFNVVLGAEVTPNWILLPLLIPAILQAGLLALAVGFFTSWLTARYRDLVFLLAFVVNLWLYATPVIYPISRVPEAWQWAIWLNPMAPIVEFFKAVLLGAGTINIPAYAISVCVTVVLFFAGMMIFQRTERDFVDSV
jgi:lipopolysaccharide transport system permease protein